jgi:ectoine hydroxylase-related dioxygenase (phytanoyl-CoA dioxygenase family)
MTTVNDKVFADPGMLAAHGDGGAEERVLGEIKRLGLEQNAWELDTAGYTVLTPQQVAPPAFIEAMRERILDASEALNGVRPDVVSGATHTEGMTNIGRSELLGDVLFSDRIFEQALMNERVLAMVTYLLGESCTVVAMNGVIKGPGPEHTPLHADSVQPNPLPAYSQQCNATWLLTDYDEASGATLFQPGSHKRCRNPTAVESADLSATVPLIAPAGSVAIWHGNTWHAALPRTAPGLRVSLLTFFHRVYLRPPKESFAGRVTQEMLDRNGERFARLTGATDIDRDTECLTRHSQFA